MLEHKDFNLQKRDTHMYILNSFLNHTDTLSYVYFAYNCESLTQSEWYLYTNPKLIVYNGRLNITCRVLTSMQPSSSISFHVSFNNILILYIHTPFDCIENILETLKFTKPQNFLIFV